jgi:DNA-3-methyladenine glycosylase
MVSYQRSFFERPTLEVAQDLIGAKLHFQSHSGIITETEAYIGQSDPACQAAKGLTPRTKVMFGPAGFSYIYFIYGMYHCLNLVTETEGFPAAVLIRGVFTDQNNLHLNGPGKLCKTWGITLDYNNTDLCNNNSFYVTIGIQPKHIIRNPRIGIKVGTDHLWRFVMSNPDLKDIHDN